MLRAASQFMRDGAASAGMRCKKASLHLYLVGPDAPLSSATICQIGRGHLPTFQQRRYTQAQGNNDVCGNDHCRNEKMAGERISNATAAITGLLR
jgi:hypothetical protein